MFSKEKKRLLDQDLQFLEKRCYLDAKPTKKQPKILEEIWLQISKDNRKSGSSQYHESLQWLIKEKNMVRSWLHGRIKQNSKDFLIKKKLPKNEYIFVGSSSTKRQQDYQAANEWAAKVIIDQSKISSKLRSQELLPRWNDPNVLKYNFFGEKKRRIPLINPTTGQRRSLQAIQEGFRSEKPVNPRTRSAKPWQYSADDPPKESQDRQENPRNGGARHRSRWLLEVAKPRFVIVRAD